MTKYLTDDDFKLRVKMLSALAFVPVSDVVANFESLATTFLNDELPLLGYFESTWIDLQNVTEMTNNSLPEDSSMKKTVQRQRKRDNLAANPDLALACDRSLLLLQIPPTLLSAWKVFDSGPSSTRVIILTTEPNLDFLCQSMRWCGDGTFKAAPELFTQLYTIHGMKRWDI